MNAGEAVNASAPAPSSQKSLFCLPAISRSCLLALFVASAAQAHGASATRTLRLQLQPDGVEGLLVYRAPPLQARLFAVPAGATPLALRLAPEALRGLSLSLGPEPLPPRTVDFKSRALLGGALEASLVLRFRAAPPRAGQVLRVAVEEGVPLPVQLFGPTGTRLVLLKGPGAAIDGGLALHPRPGTPCEVRLELAP